MIKKRRMTESYDNNKVKNYICVLTFHVTLTRRTPNPTVILINRQRKLRFHLWLVLQNFIRITITV